MVAVAKLSYRLHLSTPTANAIIISLCPHKMLVPTDFAFIITCRFLLIISSRLRMSAAKLERHMLRKRNIFICANRLVIRLRCAFKLRRTWHMQKTMESCYRQKGRALGMWLGTEVTRGEARLPPQLISGPLDFSGIALFCNLRCHARQLCT